MTDFEQLYETYFNDVYLYILRLSGNEHIAEEITSDTFFKITQKIGEEPKVDESVLDNATPELKSAVQSGIEHIKNALGKIIPTLDKIK